MALVRETSSGPAGTMFEYAIIIFAFWQCGMYGHVSAIDQADTIVQFPTVPEATMINDTVSDKPVQMHGYHNYYTAQQIFYINPQQQLKQQINAARIDELTKKDYIISSGIGAHKLHLRKLTWNKARKACIDEGGHLAVINSKEEEKILLRMLNQENVAWLGVHDIFEEGEWVTVLDEALENTGYSRWTTIYANEPDNYGGKQNCAILVEQGGMDDIDCGAMCPYICEISIT